MSWQSIEDMTWWEYVVEHGGDNQSLIARALETTSATVSRWKTSQPRPESVAAFAHAYRRPVLEAFVAAGFLTPEDAAVKIGESPTWSLDKTSDEDLLAEVRRRMSQGGQRDGRTPEAEKSVSRGTPDLLKTERVSHTASPGKLDGVVDGTGVDTAENRRPSRMDGASARNGTQ